MVRINDDFVVGTLVTIAKVADTNTTVDVLYLRTLDVV